MYICTTKAKIELSLNQLSKSLKDFPSVVIKFTINFIDSFIFNDPELALRLLNQPGIVTDQNYTYTQPRHKQISL